MPGGKTDNKTKNFCEFAHAASIASWCVFRTRKGRCKKNPFEHAGALYVCSLQTQ